MGYENCGRKKEYTPEVIESFAKKLTKFFENPEKMFVLEFCVENEIASQRISEFAAVNTTFSEALKRANDIQKVRIMKAGLSSSQKSTMSIFLLKGICGIRENETPQQVTINNYGADQESKGDIEKHMMDRKLVLQNKRKKAS